MLGGLFSSPGSVWTRSSVNLRGRSHCWSGSGSFSRSGSNGAAAIMIGPHRPPPLHPTFRVGRDRGTMVAEVERREAYLPTTMWSRPPAAAHWSAVNNCLPHVQASGRQPVARCLCRGATMWRAGAIGIISHKILLENNISGKISTSLTSSGFKYIFLSWHILSKQHLWYNLH